MSYNIYGLYKNDIIFYIGKTKNIKSRFQQHKYTYGKDINIKVLKLCANENDLSKWEIRYIKWYSLKYKL